MGKSVATRKATTVDAIIGSGAALKHGVAMQVGSTKALAATSATGKQLERVAGASAAYVGRMGGMTDVQTAAFRNLARALASTGGGMVQVEGIGGIYVG